MKTLMLCTALLGTAWAGALQAEDLTKVRFVHEWRIEGHLAPYFVALDKGYYTQEGLDVTIDPGTGSIDSINRVASGSYELGQADINALIKYRSGANTQPIKAVMMAYNAPSFAFLTLAKNGIRSPKDLEGRVLGAPAADGAYAHWPIIAKLNQIDTSRVKVENVGFAVRETMLAQGQVDAVTAFTSNALALRTAGIPQDEIITLPMSDFGLDLYGSAIIARPEFAEKNPDAVRGFVRATIRGYLDTFADPEAAIESIVKANPMGRRDIELERLKVVIARSYLTDEVRKNGFGDIDKDRVERSIDQLAISFDFQNRPGAEDVFTPEFLPPLPERIPGAAQ